MFFVYEVNMTIVRLAIQKSGRLTEASRTLIAEHGIELDPMGASLRAQALNFPLEVLFLRDDDIPGYMANGVVDAPIVGHNVLVARGSQADVVRELEFGRCRLLQYFPPL
jgi:ATP phosphoribosyltransferase